MSFCVFGLCTTYNAVSIFAEEKDALILRGIAESGKVIRQKCTSYEELRPKIY